jgi:purine-cytosine permease-like protein
MSTGPGDPHHPRQEFAHDVEELKDDLAFEREALDASIRHDYSTSDTGIVPLDRRRPQWHFAGLWTTFAAGFSFLFLGFELHAGNSIGRVVGITVLGYGLYAAYAMFGAYLGSRTGQTHGLLTRSIFGLGGSWIVCAFVLVAPLGWVGFQAGLMVQIWDGLYGWGHVFTLTLAFAGIMILNNLLGFTGISVFARYLVTPLIILWVVYMVIKAAITDSDKLGGTPAGPGFPFWVGVVAVIGFAMWGNEPDVWRYGKPAFWWALPSYLFAGFMMLLFVVGGWMMAQLAGSSADFAGQMKFISHYSLFGAFWLAWILATISQFAINDGNYYESVNAGQNLVGGWKQWRRWYTCLLVAGGGVIAGWLVNYHYIDGWFKVAGFLAVTVPCATVIMAVDHFLLPRLFNISRPLTKVPAWEETGFINIPAVAALLGAVFFGVTGTAVWPGGWIYASEPNGWGPVPVEAWAMAGILYIAGVAIARSVVPNLRNVLAFSKYVRDEDVTSGKVADIASPV